MAGQVDDLIAEIRDTITNGHRVLVNNPNQTNGRRSNRLLVKKYKSNISTW